MARISIKSIIHYINTKSNRIAHPFIGFAFAHLVEWINVFILWGIMMAIVCMKETYDIKLYNQPLKRTIGTLVEYSVGFVAYVIFWYYIV